MPIAGRKEPGDPVRCLACVCARLVRVPRLATCTCACTGRLEYKGNSCRMTELPSRQRSGVHYRGRETGGGGRNRTGVDGFAGRCMTTLPPRRTLAADTLRPLRTAALEIKNQTCRSIEYTAGSDHCSARQTKGKLRLPFEFWSGRRVSNSRPQPWQGCALPTELLPRTQQKKDYSSNFRSVKPVRVASFAI
jgi:hypothetical protein